MVIKKVFILAVTLFTALALAGVPRATHAAAPAQYDQMEEGTLKDIQGTVKGSGDKAQFVTDGDGRVWDVVNPEVFKGHENQHVQINCHLFPSKNKIHVHTVKKLKN
jgi:hypothetical protein